MNTIYILYLYEQFNVYHFNNLCLLKNIYSLYKNIYSLYIINIYKYI